MNPGVACDCDVEWSELYRKRKHLSCTAGDLTRFLADTGSTNGSWFKAEPGKGNPWNKLEKHTIVNMPPGSLVRFGKVELSLEVSAFSPLNQHDQRAPVIFHAATE